MASQSQKYHLAMAAEYFVAAQLQRLGVAASVTYGNAKSADVIALDRMSGKAVVIEVKSSSSGRWLVGSRVPAPSLQPWVFVFVPQEIAQAPEFFVVTQAQLHRALAPKERQYLERYEAKHGEEYGDKPGVAAATRLDLASYLNAWETIVLQLRA